MTRKAATPQPVKPWLCGPLTHGKPGRHHVEPPANFESPTRVTNSMSRDPLDLRAIWTAPVRQGADHSHLQSKGGC